MAVEDEIKIQEPSALSEATSLSTTDELFVVHNGSTYTGTLADIVKIVTKSVVDTSGLPVNGTAVTSALNGALANQTDYNIINKLGGGYDFNTLYPTTNLKQSTYFVYGDTSNPNTNAPNDLNTTNFIVIVFTCGAGSSIRLKQVAYQHEDANLMYIRSRRVNQNWTSWEKVTTNSDLANYPTKANFQDLTYLGNTQVTGSFELSQSLLNFNLIYISISAKDESSSRDTFEILPTLIIKNRNDEKNSMCININYGDSNNASLLFHYYDAQHIYIDQANVKGWTSWQFTVWGII